MKWLRDVVGWLLLLAIGLRVAAEIIAPLIPALVLLFALVCIFWVVVGRPGGRL